MEPLAFPRRLLSRLLSRLLAAASATGADPAAVGRQLPILHSCVPDDDVPMLLARATRPGDNASYLLLLTERRLVVVGESRVLRRQRLHLNADRRHLVDVLWTPEPALGAVALSATAVDGVREHFWIRTADVAAATEALSEVFAPALV
jgi:hypothetical protein